MIISDNREGKKKRKVRKKKKEIMKVENFMIKEKSSCIGVGKKKVEDSKKSQII